jgi:hypothetical protein
LGVLVAIREVGVESNMGLTADDDYFDEAWELSQVDSEGTVDSLAVYFINAPIFKPFHSTCCK